MKPTTLATVPLLISAAALAQDAPTDDKSAYTLANPTPRELWRPMSADRPDFTESPYTVDAGAVQIEASFVEFTNDGDAESFSIAPTNLKIGLTNSIDAQFVFTPYTHEDDGATTRDGLGDTQFRLKINLWGNDGGDTAFAIMPFVNLPTASDDLDNDHIEGGVILPFSTELAEGVGLGLMFETDFVYDEADEDYDTEFVFTGVLGFDLTDELGAYVEGIGILSTDGDTDERAFLGLGLTYALSGNAVLDLGATLGLTDDTEDVTLFSGITLRF